MLRRRRDGFTPGLFLDAVLRFEALQVVDFGRAKLFGSPQLKSACEVTLGDDALDGALHVAEGEGRIAMTGPAQDLLDKPQPMVVSREPGVIETFKVVVGDVSEGHRQTGTRRIW